MNAVDIKPQTGCRGTAYPRAITTIKQIEPTTRCNLKCSYCPSPNLPRKKEDMTWPIFEAALVLARHFADAGTQGEFCFTGIGEPLLHSRFVDMVAAARQALPRTPMMISTNGVLLDDAMCAALEPYTPQIWVSLHRPEHAVPAMAAAARHGLLAGHNNSVVFSSFDWAGQLSWPVTAPATVCAYLEHGWGTVLVDGRITRCCLDADGSGTLGHVHDDPATLGTSPWTLCKTCHMVIP